MKKILTALLICIFCFSVTVCNKKAINDEIDELDFRALDCVELYNYDNHKIQTQQYTLTSDELKSIIEIDMTSHNQFIPVTDRDIPENNDILFLNLKAENGETKIIESENYCYQVGSKAFSEEFDNRLKNTSLNKKISFSIDFEKDFENKLIAGKNIFFTVCINKISRSVNITDKNVITEYYGCSNMDEVYEMLIEESNTQAVFDEIYARICTDSIVNKIPNVLKKLTDTAENSHRNTGWINEYIILKAICEKEGITFTEDDFINECNSLARENNLTVSDVEHTLDRYSICYYMMHSAVYEALTSE